MEHIVNLALACHRMVHSTFRFKMFDEGNYYYHYKARWSQKEKLGVGRLWNTVE